MLDVEVVLAAIRMKTSVIGFCFNKKHVSVAYDRLAKVTFASMRDPASELNEPAL